MATCDDCQVSLNIVGECGIEISNNIIYSIGCQLVNYTNLVDTCNCVDQIYINSVIPPTLVADGCPINVEVTLNPTCFLCEQLVSCQQGGFSLKKKINLLNVIKKRLKFIKC